MQREANVFQPDPAARPEASKPVSVTGDALIICMDLSVRGNTLLVLDEPWG